MTFLNKLWEAIKIARTRSAIERIRQMGYVDIANNRTKKTKPRHKRWKSHLTH